MAWSNLKSNWVVGDSLGASDLNSMASAVNILADGTAGASVATSESTSSTTYADLTTTTDTVTVTVGSGGKVLVFLSVELYSASSNWCLVGVALSGANTVAAADTQCIKHQPVSSGSGYAVQVGIPLYFSGLTAGSTTFKMKYKVSSSTGNFLNRRITVIPLP